MTQKEFFSFFPYARDGLQYGFLLFDRPALAMICDDESMGLITHSLQEEQKVMVSAEGNRILLAGLVDLVFCFAPIFVFFCNCYEIKASIEIQFLEDIDRN